MSWADVFNRNSNLVISLRYFTKDVKQICENDKKKNARVGRAASVEIIVFSHQICKFAL